MSLFEGVVKRNDEIEDDGKRVENLIRGILAGNIFDLGSAQVSMLICMSFLLVFTCYGTIVYVNLNQQFNIVSSRINKIIFSPHLSCLKIKIRSQMHLSNIYFY